MGASRQVCRSPALDLVTQQRPPRVAWSKRQSVGPRRDSSPPNSTTRDNRDYRVSARHGAWRPGYRARDSPSHRRRNDMLAPGSPVSAERRSGLGGSAPSNDHATVRPPRCDSTSTPDGTKHVYPTPRGWSLRAPPYWTERARIVVFPWILRAHTNS